MNAAQVINLGGLLNRTARLFPDHDAVIQGDQRWTWKQIDLRVSAMAIALSKLGLK